MSYLTQDSKFPSSIVPKVACLCPTYGRPTLLANAAACFLAQQYPANKLRLYILDDAGQFIPTNPQPYQTPDGSFSHPAPNIFLISYATRFLSLPAKYDYLLKMAKAFDPDIWLVWDDDDVYLPDYVNQHVAAHLIASATRPGDDTGVIPPVFNCWSQPNPVLSDYTNSLQPEPSDGRFHGSLGIGKHLMRKLAGWPPTRRADFDQQMIRMCHNFGPELNANLPLQPGVTPQYIFRWGSTGGNHCQGLMKSPDNEDWYDRYTITEPGFVGHLLPRFDRVTIEYFTQLGYQTQTSDELLART